MPHKTTNEIYKGIKIYPKEISLTAVGKTGLSLLFWKSEQNGGSDAMTISDEARASLEKSYAELSKFKDQFPGIVEALEKAQKESISPKKVEEIIKSDDVSPEVKALIQGLSSQLKDNSEKLTEFTKRYEDEQKAKAATKVQELKKSCEDFSKSLAAMPQDALPEGLLFEVEKAVSPEIAAQLRNFLTKAQEAMKLAVEKAAAGKDPSGEQVITGNGKVFAEELKKALDADTSSDAREIKLIKNLKSLSEKDPTGYASYNKMVNEGNLPAVQ